MKIDIEKLTQQVLHNCAVSDSRYAGLYSICGLALRLRDLFKWENGLAPWVEKASDEVLDWIGKKEKQWESFADKEIAGLRIQNKPYDPFDVTGINAILEPQGFYYGAGYGRGLKPTYLLAEIDDKRRIDGHTVYFLGKELARDLFTVPAVAQQNCILIRKKTAQVHLWERMLYVKKSGRRALHFALNHYGLQEQDRPELKRNLSKISDDESETYIYHELGEIKGNDFDREVWREMIAAYPNTAVEFLARTIKDLLADTNEYGTLQYILREKKATSLGFYIAFMEGLPKALFQELIEAFDEFLKKENWDRIEQAVTAGYQTSRRYAQMMTRIFQRGKQKKNTQWAEQEISERLLRPLGI